MQRSGSSSYSTIVIIMALGSTEDIRYTTLKKNLLKDINFQLKRRVYIWSEPDAPEKLNKLVSQALYEGVRMKHFIRELKPLARPDERIIRSLGSLIYSLKKKLRDYKNPRRGYKARICQYELRTIALKIFGFTTAIDRDILHYIDYEMYDACEEI